ncbi:MAG: S26 family signal peptidase [Pseudomonadota bacterium]
MKSSRFITVFSRGGSMSPTLPSAAALLVEPYGERRIRRGDVVVYRLAGSGHAVAHRVASINADRITTKGDANRDDDPWTTSIHEVTGRVRYVCNGTGRRKTHGGPVGVCIAGMVKARRFVVRLGSGIVRRPLHWIAHWIAVRKILSLTCKPKVIRFQRSGDPAFLLMVGRRMVGRFLQERNEWTVRYPYAFFVDKNTLPKP